MMSMKKIAQIALVSATFTFAACSFKLSEDNRPNVYSELFGGKTSFDYKLFEEILNHKFSKLEARQSFYEFVKKVGGFCSNENQCVVPIQSTICVSSKAIITINDNHFKVTSFTDGC